MEDEGQDLLFLDLLVILGLAGLDLVVDKVAEGSEDDEEDKDGEDDEEDHDEGARVVFSAVGLADLLVLEVKVVRALELAETDVVEGLAAGGDNVSASGTADGALEAVAVAGREGLVAGVLLEGVIAGRRDGAARARRAEGVVELLVPLDGKGVVVEGGAVVPDGVVDVSAELEGVLVGGLAVARAAGVAELVGRSGVSSDDDGVDGRDVKVVGGPGEGNDADASVAGDHEGHEVLEGDGAVVDVDLHGDRGSADELELDLEGSVLEAGAVKVPEAKG
mmetsp:Transcript_6378/g.9904  ORF Transcript_6378/g.9904 Transcript_6378/m.9904 type:complete len:278 (+) Transcript_6378:276-1109(+)